MCQVYNNIIITKWLYWLKIKFVFIVVDRKNPKDWQDLASPHQSQKLTRNKQEPRGDSSSCQAVGSVDLTILILSSGITLLASITFCHELFKALLHLVIFLATCGEGLWPQPTFGLFQIALCCFCSDSAKFLHMALNSFRNVRQNVAPMFYPLLFSSFWDKNETPAELGW